MTTTKAEVVITGRNNLTGAVRSAERDLKGLLKQGELIGKLFRGGAIAGAFYAFERMAESAQKAAEAIGEKGTARSLKALNKEIDTLKSKGLNVIGTVLGNAFAAVAGDRQAKLEEQIDFLERMQGRSFVAAGYKDIGTGFFTAAEGAAKLLELQEKLAVFEKNQPAGSRLRAPGSHGGGRSVQATPWGKETAVTAKDILAQFDDVAITARQISVGAVEQMYQDMNAATATAVQQQAKEWGSLEGQINELLRAGRISPDDAAGRSAELMGNYFEDIKITAEKIFPKAEQDKLNVFAEQAGRNLQDTFADFLFDPFKDGLDGMLAGFIDTIRRMVAEAAAAEILRGVFSWAAGATSGKASSFFTSLAGARASGGPVSGGSAYLVGERGPEVFVPSASGTVMANGAGGGVSLHYSIDARGADAERIMAILPGLLKQTSDQTVQRIRDLNERGRL